MAGELNTEVRDDPAACRAMAEWLRGAASGVQRIGDAVYRERGESESFWQGTAGDACRAELTDEGKDSDTLERLIRDTERALDGFANRIDTVRTRMEEARRIAREGGLIVTPTAILPPAPGPGPAPKRPVDVGPISPAAERRFAEATESHRAAEAAHQAQQATFDRVAPMVDDARREQAAAHRDLDKAMQDPLATIKTLKTYTMFAVGNGLSVVKARQTTANDLFEEADSIEQHGRRMQEIAEDPRNPASTRALAERAAQTSSQGAENTRALGEKIEPRGPGWLRQGVEANPGNYIKDGTGLLKLGKSAARGVPFVGTGLALVSGGVDVALGKDPKVAAAETGANLAGGVVGGMAGAEVGGAIGTAIFPGIGTAIGGVVGGVVGGIVGSMSGTKAADQAMGVQE